MGQKAMNRAAPQTAQPLLSTEADSFRLPAEWEPHEATWIGWPANLTDWPGKFAPIPWTYAEIARKITPGEILRVIVNSRAHQARAQRVLARARADRDRIEFFRFPSDRGWTRDFGPCFVERAGSERGLAIARFQFNAWAKYPDWRKDALVPGRVGRALSIPVVDVWAKGEPGKRVVLEGGAIDVNGRGTLITTEECLLDQTRQARNPGLAREDLEDLFRRFFGVTNVLWLGRGIAGDDTHGHVDDICRFVNPTTVVFCLEDNPEDENYRPLQENRERLEDMRLEDGSRVERAALPMPAPLFFDSQRLPASYANFYIANAAVLVPTFNDSKDRVALGILSDFFPDRSVVGIHAVDLVWGLGTLHCLTREQPAR